MQCARTQLARTHVPVVQGTSAMEFTVQVSKPRHLCSTTTYASTRGSRLMENKNNQTLFSNCLCISIVFLNNFSIYATFHSTSDRPALLIFSS